MTNGAILEIDGLKTHFHTRDGIVRAVDGVSIRVDRGETLSIVGESGCGKSVTAMSVLRLLPVPPAKIEAGRILFDGEDLLLATEERMREIRGNRISMIFQEPMTSLNPVMPVGRQIAESLELHQALGRRAAAEQGESRCSTSCRFPSPGSGRGNIPTSFRAGCASG